MKFVCTPFYLNAVEELRPHVDFYKIASYELLWHDLHRAIAKTGKPVVLSTGMATIEEIGAAIEALQSAGTRDITLLHCVSAYPAPPEKSNLSAIEALRREFGLPVGWSDHTVSPEVIARAVHRFDARIVEFHLDIDESGVEHDFGHNWSPLKMKETIDAIRIGESADGDGAKGPVDSEMEERQWRADPSDGLRPFKEIR